LTTLDLEVRIQTFLLLTQRHSCVLTSVPGMFSTDSKVFM